MDRDTFSSLLDALPDDGMAVSEHLAVLLELIAVNLRAVMGGEPPQPRLRRQREQKIQRSCRGYGEASRRVRSASTFGSPHVEARFSTRFGWDGLLN